MIDLLHLQGYSVRKQIMEITLQMVPGYPAGILRNGFRGGFPHAARRMLSFEQKIKMKTENGTLQESQSTKSFRHSEDVKKYSNFKDNRQAVAENFNHLVNTSIQISSKSTLDYNIETSKYLQKVPWQQRSLLWSPPQIFSSVLKVFRKVLYHVFKFPT